MRRFISGILPLVILWASMGKCSLCLLMPGTICHAGIADTGCPTTEPQACQFSCCDKERLSPETEYSCERCSSDSDLSLSISKCGAGHPCHCRPQSDHFSAIIHTGQGNNHKIPVNGIVQPVRIESPIATHKAPGRSLPGSVHPSVETTVLRC